VSWFDNVKNRAWDEQMEADAAAGKLDFLFEEAEGEMSLVTCHWSPVLRPQPSAFRFPPSLLPR